MWRHPAAKPLLALLLAWPACWLLWAAFHDQLGPNPAEALIRQSGDWALRALCVALAVTPLRVITGQVLLMRFRRMLGVNVFVYAALHMLSYAWLDMGLDLEDIARDIAKRPFILVGFLALLVLSALAATSFNKAVRWLGDTALASLAPQRVCRGSAGGAAFLLDASGEEQPDRGVDLRCHFGHLVGLARVALVA